MASYRSGAILLAALVVASSAGAEPIRKWRTPDGRVHLGEKPPAGSVLVGESADAEAWPDAAPDADADAADAAAVEERRFSVDVSLRRRAIEKKLKSAAERLRAPP